MLLALPVVQVHGLLVLRGTSVVHVSGLCVFLELPVAQDRSDVVGTSVVLSVVSQNRSDVVGTSVVLPVVSGVGSGIKSGY